MGHRPPPQPTFLLSDGGHSAPGFLLESAAPLVIEEFLARVFVGCLFQVSDPRKQTALQGLALYPVRKEFLWQVWESLRVCSMSSYWIKTGVWQREGLLRAENPVEEPSCLRVGVRGQIRWKEPYLCHPNVAVQTLQRVLVFSRWEPPSNGSADSSKCKGYL